MASDSNLASQWLVTNQDFGVTNHNKMTQIKTAVPRFGDLGIAPTLLAAVENLFTEPTPIQHQVIPAALEGKDIIGIAQTGTGKTLAFGIPVLQQIAQKGGQGLILLPTRELAIQVEEMLQKVGRQFNLRTATLIGGVSSRAQVQKLRRQPHIVVATPGRLMDHLRQKTYSLDRIKIIVLDEADRMMDIGFMPQIRQIFAVAPKERQTLLFSATMPPAIIKITADFMAMPLRIEVAPPGTPAAHIEQEIIVTHSDMKQPLLVKILADYPGTILVFVRTKYGAAKLSHSLRQLGHTAEEIHSNRSLVQRRLALENFKSGKCRVLIATDIAARGLDVKDISLVVNYDLPDNSEDYVHRIGRTGRAGSAGKAISFATSREQSDVKAIERLIKRTIPIINNPWPMQTKKTFSASHSRAMSRQKNKYSRRRFSR